MKDYTAYYHVKCYFDGEKYTEAGFVNASSYTDAMATIEKYYGDELAVVTHLELLDCSILTMKVEQAKELVENLWV